MKRILIVAFIFCYYACHVSADDIVLNEVNFPDANFRAYLSNKVDTNGDGILTESERYGGFTEFSMPMQGKGIANFKGLEYFNPRLLNIASNPLTETVLDLSHCTRLEQLTANSSNITKIILPNNSRITYLRVDNNQLTSIDVTSCPNLEHFQCQNNKLTELDVSQNTKLKKLYCSGNPVNTLDLANNSELDFLSCGSMKLKELDLSHNTALTYLYCPLNELNSLDCSMLTNLNTLNGIWQYATLNLVVLGEDRDQLGVALTPGWKEENVENIRLNSMTETPSITPQKITWKGTDYLQIAGDLARDAGEFYNRNIFYDYNPECPSMPSARMENVRLTVKPYVMYLHPATYQDSVYTGTLYIDYPAYVPEEAGAKCYYATGLNNDESLILQEITGTIPARTPIVVTTTEPKYLAFYEDESAEANALTPPTDNILAGSLNDINVTPRSVLTLGHDKSTGLMGFWNYSGTTVKAHRAYVPASVLSAAALSKRGLTFSFPDNTTGISKAKNNAAGKDNCYDLQGRLVKPTQKGVYIVNGKKIRK